MSPQAILALVFVIVCAYTDVRRGRIYNIITLPMMLVGLAVNLMLRGLGGLLDATYGLLAGFLIGLILVSLRVFFGGDLKLLMAFGAMTGFRCATQTALLSLIFLGIQGAVTLVAKGAFRRTARALYTWALLRIGKVQTPVPASGMTMPAAPAFLVAAIIVISRGGI